MEKLMSPEFGDRKVATWLRMAEAGEVALPSFQRSYVWRKRESIEDYLLAVIQNRPTGVFLVLKTGDEPPFESRSLRGIKADAEKAKELLLDGQQRLTSLWRVLNGDTPSVTYYLKVQNLKALDVSACDVVSFTDSSRDGKELADPKTAYARNLVPMSILQNKKGDDGIGQVWRWCSGAVENNDQMYLLEKALLPVGEDLLKRRKLHFCRLGADTDKARAIDIFVQSNRSSVRVNEFDIAVALALEEGELELRDRLESFHEGSGVAKYYLKAGQQDTEAAIPELGEWVLFAACLREKGIAPKRGRFEEVVRDVFANGSDDPQGALDRALHDAEGAMKRLAEYGASIRQLLPALPTLHVLAGLERDLSALSKATHISIGKQLIEEYLWRSFFSDRYGARGNDRLFEDYRLLRKCVQQIQKAGSLEHCDLPPVFDPDHYPVGVEVIGGLDSPVPWIKTTSRLGLAVATLQLAEDPLDWITGETLNATKVRQLHDEGKLDRHHVFPRKVLRGLFAREEINHGLNGVVLRDSSNNFLSDGDPAEYIKRTLDQPHGPTEDVLRKRIESHLVPYDVISGGGSVQERYEAFIERRRELIVAKIAEKCTLGTD